MAAHEEDGGGLKSGSSFKAPRGPSDVDRSSKELHELFWSWRRSGVELKRSELRRDEKSDAIRTTFRSNSTPFVAGPGRGEGCRSSGLVVSSSPTRKVVGTGLHGEATVMKREYRVGGERKRERKARKKKINFKENFVQKKI